jgi:hypothetical protein
MIILPNVTLLHMVYSPSMEHLDSGCRVIRFVQSFIQFKRTLLLTYKEPRIPVKADVVQIPHFNYEGVQIFLLKMNPMILDGLVMTVHADGFPFCPSMWSNEFLKYDFIGAPWDDGVVGNAGFCIHSDFYRKACMNLPFVFGDSDTAADVIPNRTYRAYFESMGVQFAPTEVAQRFSTEMTCQDKPSFGFHGSLKYYPKYAVAWKALKEWESKNV